MTEKFDWATADMVLLQKLISDPHLSAEDVVRRLADKVDNRPTRSALLGFLARRPSLQEIWAKARRRPMKTVAHAKQPKPRIAVVGGVVVPGTKAVAAAAVIDVVAPRWGERRVPLSELRVNECKFPVDEDDSGEVVGRHLFCGNAVAPGRVYCTHHAGIAFNPNRGRQLPGTYVKTEPKRISKLLAKTA